MFYTASAVSQTTATVRVVPNQVKFSGTATDLDGKPVNHIVGITFCLYQKQEGGVPLWLETQNILPDENGHYSVSLGATKPDGVPLDLFSSGQAQWLGAQIEGQAEQPRVFLMSVPYALKAADAETIGGLPPSAFMLAAPGAVDADQTSQASRLMSSNASALSPATVTGSGTANFVPLWTSASNLASSVLFQSGSGGTAKIGINTTTPIAALDIKGSTNLQGLLNSAATGTATASSGKASQAQNFVASAFSSTSGAAIKQTFQWKAEPAGNNTANPSGTLDLLFGSGTNVPVETGLKISNKGLFTFSAGQIFPGTGSVTSVAMSAPSSDFTVSGSPITKSGTLILAWTNPPTSANTANTIVKRDSSGNFSANAITGNTLGANGPINGQTVTATNVSSGDFVFGILGQEYGTGKTIGIEGLAGSQAGKGVYGIDYLPSTEGKGFSSGTGVWGDTSVVGGVGLLGTVDEGSAVLGFNNSNCIAGLCNSTEFLENDQPNSNDFGFVLTTLGTFGNGGLGGFCDIDTDGGLSCSGFTSSVVSVQGGSHNVALYAVHSPQNWFEDFGSGQLSNGVATVSLEPTFSHTVNTGVEYHVFLTPNGDSRGLYVAKKAPTSFEVREQGGGKSSIAFDYRIVALRQGAETIRLEDQTERVKKLLAQAAAHRRASSGRSSHVAVPVASAR